jgi:septal ring factor EnvC (AmiA/AmiB activator)
MNNQPKKYDKEKQKFIDTQLDHLSELDKQAKKLNKESRKIAKQLNAHLATLKAIPNPTPQDLEDIAQIEALGINRPLLG